MQVAIIGNGIIANLAALYLRRRLDKNIDIVIIGPESRGGMPVVGESTIEITAQFLENKLGLGDYLQENHYPKYALTYYFKLDHNNPDDRRYSVQCNERAPEDIEELPGWKSSMARPPSWQLNRTVFDRDIQNIVSNSSGIQRILGMVSEVNLSQSSSLHSIKIKQENKAETTVNANWVIDASGRKQFLAKRLNLIQKPKTGQRNCFWFRLKNFQRDILKQIDALGPMPPAKGEDYHYDRYYSTHHFMGKGNWIWLIPMRTADNTELISIGLSSRPDVYPCHVRNITDFVRHVSATHPVITDLVNSGEVVDSNTFSNYRYTIKQAYSENRWCIIGDAAFAPDPLFSNGLAFSSIQIEQVGEMIARDYHKKHCAEYIEKLEKVFWAPVHGSQNTITEWYKNMDDPLLCAAQLNFIEVSYFYWLLPLVVNRCHYDPERLKAWEFMQASAGKPLQLPIDLLAEREKIEYIVPEHFIYYGKEKVNRKALKAYKSLRDMRAQMIVGADLLSEYTKELISTWQNSLITTDCSV